MRKNVVYELGGGGGEQSVMETCWNWWNYRNNNFQECRNFWLEWLKLSSWINEHKLHLSVVTRKQNKIVIWELLRNTAKLILYIKRASEQNPNLRSLRTLVIQYVLFPFRLAFWSSSGRVFTLLKNKSEYILCVLDRASSWYLNKGWPTWWHLLYYLLLNMFRMLIHPSSAPEDGCINIRNMLSSR